MFYYDNNSGRPTMKDYYDIINNTKQQPIFSTSSLFQTNNVEAVLVVGLAIFCVAILAALLCLYKLFGLLG
ncbi:hypothetical protein IJQ19_01860 [bacterium]|nr:hypothetical protein [bacterium]